MRIRTITRAAVLALTVILSTQLTDAQLPTTGDSKPVVKLLLNLTRLTIQRQAGTISIVINAAASDGFSGQLAGSITVSAPTNPSGVELSAGSVSQTFAFKLSAGQAISDTRQLPSFTIKTSPQNHQSGIVMYSVYVDPSDRFMTIDSPTIVKVITVP